MYSLTKYSINIYLLDRKYFGCVVGRVANRIALGKFKVDGIEYQLAKNNGPNSLHGGLKVNTSVPKSFYTICTFTNNVSFKLIMYITQLLSKRYFEFVGIFF